MEASASDTEVSTLIGSIINETKESIDEMYKENDQPCLESNDDIKEAAHYEIEKILCTARWDGNVDFHEEKMPKMKLSKRKAMKAWLKDRLGRNGNDPITKFFGLLRRLRKKYKRLKKQKNHSKGMSKNMSTENWKLTIQLILLIAVVAILVCALIAMLVSSGPTVPIALSLASLLLAFFTFLQDWCENLFSEVKTEKRCDSGEVKKEKGCDSGALMELDERNFKDRAMERLQSVEKSFNGGPKDQGKLANIFKGMLDDGENEIKKIREKKTAN